jgi:DNA-binding Lrp family transcriptional regulator
MNENQKLILKFLTENSRYTNSQIASMTGLSEAEVESIVKELEESRIIVKYTTVVNPDSYQSTDVEALIQVKVKPQKLKGFDALAEELCAFEEIKGLYLISGGFDLAVMVTAKDLNSVARFVSEKLSAVDGVISVSSHFILKKYKIEGQTTTLPLENKRQILL